MSNHGYWICISFSVSCKNATRDIAEKHRCDQEEGETETERETERLRDKERERLRDREI